MTSGGSGLRPLAFLVPTLAVAVTSGEPGGGPVRGVDLLVVACVCTLAGVVWQVWHPRDLVDRFTYLAALYVAAAGLFLVAAGSPVESTVQLGVGAGGVVTGCVYAEQWRRRRRATTPR